MSDWKGLFCLQKCPSTLFEVDLDRSMISSGLKLFFTSLFFFTGLKHQRRATFLVNLYQRCKKQTVKNYLLVIYTKTGLVFFSWYLKLVILHHVYKIMVILHHISKSLVILHHISKSLVILHQNSFSFCFYWYLKLVIPHHIYKSNILGQFTPTLHCGPKSNCYRKLFLSRKFKLKRHTVRSEKFR